MNNISRVDLEEAGPSSTSTNRRRNIPTSTLPPPSYPPPSPPPDHIPRPQPFWDFRESDDEAGHYEEERGERELSPVLNIGPRPPSPLDPQIFRDHSYSRRNHNRNRNREFGEAEERLLRLNVENVPQLSPEINLHYNRLLSAFAFNYSCLDVNYEINDDEFLSTFGDYQTDVSSLFNLILTELSFQLGFVQRFKVNFGIHAVFDNPNANTSDNSSDRDVLVHHFIWLHAREIDKGVNLEIEIKDMISELIQRISTTEKGPSGLVYKYFLSTSFSFNIFAHQFGGHLTDFFNLPKFVDIKSLLVPSKKNWELDTEDDEEIETEEENDFSCFRRSLCDFFIWKYKDMELYLDIEKRNLKPKMSFADISAFEKDNPNIQIHVLVAEFQSEEEEKEEILDHYAVAYKSKNAYAEENDQIVFFLHNEHYYCITDMSGFLSQRHHSVKKGSVKQRWFFCFNCLMSFDRQSRLDEHLKFCEGKDGIIPSFPKERLEFTDYSLTISPPFVIYYDMETSYSYMKDGNIKLGDSITITDELKPIKIGYKIYFTEREVLNLYPELKAYEKVKLFHGYDCITQFFVDLKKVSYEIQLRIRYQIPLSLTSQERQDFEKSTHCCICKRSYSSDIDEQGNIRDPGLRRCKHHSHISGWIFLMRGLRNAICLYLVIYL